MTHTPLPPQILQKHSPSSNSSSPESEPFRSNNAVEVQEVVEHEVQDTQVQPHVQVRQEVPKISHELKKIGVSTKAMPQFSSYIVKKLPLDQEKLPHALNAPPTESIRWLATLTRYLMEQITMRRSPQKTTFIQDVVRLFGRDFGK